MQIKDLKVGQQFIAGNVTFEKIEPEVLDGVERNVLIISETSSLYVKGLKLQLHPDTSVDKVI